MEVFEIINNILTDKQMSKREFAQKLIALEPKSNRTGEIISDVLGIPEQFLFEESQKVRMRMIRHLLKELSEEERVYLETALNRDKNVDMQHNILELIKYAPEPLLNKITVSLQKIKNITQNV